MGAIQELIDLVIPSKCAVCGKAGADLCEVCGGLLNPAVYEVSRGHLIAYCACEYDENVSKLIVSFKEKSQTALARVIAKLMLPTVQVFTGHIERLSLVPAPSRVENFAKRGFTPSLLLVQALAKQQPVQLKVLDCLRFTRRVGDQVGLDAKERERNLSGSMAVNQKVRGKFFVLVDDVITTGSTLKEAHRVLSENGANVLGAIAFSFSQG